MLFPFRWFFLTENLDNLYTNRPFMLTQSFARTNSNSTQERRHIKTGRKLTSPPVVSPKHLLPEPLHLLRSLLLSGSGLWNAHTWTLFRSSKQHDSGDMTHGLIYDHMNQNNVSILCTTTASINREHNIYGWLKVKARSGVIDLWVIPNRVESPPAMSTDQGSSRLNTVVSTAAICFSVCIPLHIS